jgi:uncharacterized membrane protein YbhN (UPF0104 family)
MDSADSVKRLRRRIFFVVANVISIICLAWTLYGANLGELRREVEHLDWRWVAVGMILDVLAFSVQAWRWILVLKPVTNIAPWDCLRAVYVGLFASEVLPVRAAGEVIRCYLLGLWSDIPVSVTLASALIERIFDGVWLVVCLFLATRIVHLPRQFVAGGYFLASLLVVFAILLGFAMFWKQQTLDYLLGAKGLGWVHVLIEDLHLIGHSRYLYYAAMVSFPCILVQALPIYALIRAYHHLAGVGLYAAFALMVLLRLGGVVAVTPGNVGAYNGIAVIGLRLFGVAFPVAKRFSIILWTAITIPLLIAGFIAVAASGLNVGDLHKHARTPIKGRAPAPEPSVP